MTVLQREGVFERKMRELRELEIGLDNFTRIIFY